MKLSLSVKDTPKVEYPTQISFSISFLFIFQNCFKQITTKEHLREQKASTDSKQRDKKEKVSTSPLPSTNHGSASQAELWGPYFQKLSFWNGESGSLQGEE